MYISTLHIFTIIQREERRELVQQNEMEVLKMYVRNSLRSTNSKENYISDKSADIYICNTKCFTYTFF